MFESTPIARVAALEVEILSITLLENLQENSVFICVLSLAGASTHMNVAANNKPCSIRSVKRELLAYAK